VSLEDLRLKRRRLWVAALVTWSLVYAQAATAAHACAMLASASPAQAMQTSAQPMPPGCPEMAKRSGSTANVCQSHCLAGQHVYGQADVPSASIAPQVPLTVRLADEFIPARFTTSSLAPLATAPPPQLRFSRFLI
jgi:hypothetical protein